jgi:hypothetical protein
MLTIRRSFSASPDFFVYYPIFPLGSNTRQILAKYIDFNMMQAHSTLYSCNTLFLNSLCLRRIHLDQ